MGANCASYSLLPKLRIHSKAEIKFGAIISTSRFWLIFSLRWRFHSKVAPSLPQPSPLSVGYLRGLELRDCLHLMYLGLMWNCVSINFIKFWTWVETSAFVSSKIIHTYLLWLSILQLLPKKYLWPCMEVVEMGPYISKWLSSNLVLAWELLER
jgi:hypothetical protein